MRFPMTSMYDTYIQSWINMLTLVLDQWFHSLLFVVERILCLWIMLNYALTNIVLARHN